MAYALRRKVGAAVAASTSYVLSFDQAAQLPTSTVILALVRRQAGNSVDPTPTGLPATGAVLLDSPPAATGGTSRTWSGIYAIQGGTGVNGVTVTGPAAVTQVVLLAYGGMTPADWAALLASSGQAAATTGTGLTSSPALTGATDRPTIAVGFVATGAGSGSATGFGWSEGWEKGEGAGTSTSSALSWAERPVQAGATIPALSVTWGASGIGRLLGVVLRAGPPIVKVKAGGSLPSHVVQGVWDAAAGKVRPVLHWGDNVDGEPVEPPPPVTRLATMDPWRDLSPWRVPRATTATLSKTDDKAVRMRSLAAEGTVNKAAWSVRRAITTNATPLATIRNTRDPNNIITYTDVRIPLDFQPPTAGTTGLVPDANSFIIHPNGYTSSEFFKLKSINRTTNEWECQRRVNHDLRGDGISSGVRATGNSMGVGLILAHEMAAKLIPHALAISMNEKDLKLVPTSADGQLSTNGKAVWPGNTQDTQVPGKLEYSGPIPMGSWFYLDPAVNIDAATLLNGTPLNADQKAIAWAARDYGWGVTDRSGYCNLYMEPECTDTQAADARLVWREVIIPNAVRLTNQRSDNPGGGTPTATRVRPLAPPFDPSIPPLA